MNIFSSHFRFSRLRSWAIGFALVSFTGSPSALAGEGITVIPDASFLVQIVNFLFLVWVLNIILYKPIRNIIAQRKAKVEGMEGNIIKMDDDVRQKGDAFNDGIKAARAKGLLEKKDLIELAYDDEKKMIEEINNKAQENLTAIKEKIAEDAKAARIALEKELGNFSEAIGRKIIGRAV